VLLKIRGQAIFSPFPPASNKRVLLITAIISAESEPLQSPLPSLDLSTVISQLDRSGGASSGSLENRLQLPCYLNINLADACYSESQPPFNLL
jgi:hypothetical protein